MQWVVAAAVVVLGLVASALMQRRRPAAAPTQPKLDIPAQIDRSDFPLATTPWMVLVFSSASCQACSDVLRKAAVMASSELSIVEVEYSANTALHRKYGIEAVPLVAIADERGVVQRGFAGPMSATDLWAAVADAREPDVSRRSPAAGHWQCDPSTPE